MLVSVDAYSALQRSGTLRCDNQLFFDDELDNVFLPYYDWMKVQMEKRDIPRPLNAVYPLWAWYEYNGVKGGKPDCYDETEEQGYLLECDVDESQVLLSDFMLWSAVLLGSYIPPANDPDKECEETDVETIQESWQRVFDLNNHYRDYSSLKEERSVQACLWSLSLRQVMSSKPINLDG